MNQLIGNLEKMITSCPSNGGLVEYSLTMNGEAKLPLNSLLGKKISWSYQGQINCIHCGARTKKAVGQGSCWPCFNNLACNDLCIMKPETCHYAKGTCRQPKWADEHCMTDQALYLARSSGVKIGITRGGNHLTRWADQGASEALVLGLFPNRLDVGKAEKAISSSGISDRTGWQKMLKHDVADTAFEPIIEQVHEILTDEQKQYLLETPQAIQLEYPHLQWPTKIKSVKLDKVPIYTATLIAIKGQYLIFDTNEVFNVRAHSGYNIAFSWED